MTQRRSPQAQSDGQRLLSIRRIGDRLRAAIRTLVESLPTEQQGISAMSRYLGVHKATCQRVIEGIQRSGDGAAALVRFPGVEGLRLVVDAARSKGIGAPVADAAMSAISTYEELLVSNGKTQRGLLELVSSLRRNVEGVHDQDDPASPVRGRRALFEAARTVSGEEVDVKAVASLMQPHPTDPKRISINVVSSLAGVRRQLFSRPIVPFVLGASYSRFFAGATRDPGSSSDSPTFDLLPDLSSPDLKLVELETADTRKLLLVDLERPKAADESLGRRRGLTLGPADISVRFTTNAKSNPVNVPDAWLDAAVRITQPTHMLVLDIYIHTSLLLDRQPIAGCYSLAAPPGDSPQGLPDHSWHERFPETPHIEILPHGATIAPCPAYPRQEAVAAKLFEAAGLSPRKFSGFRCVVEYPIWQSEYRVCFLERSLTPPPSEAK